MLCRLADALCSCCRDIDTPARFGGASLLLSYRRLTQRRPTSWHGVSAKALPTTAEDQSFPWYQQGLGVRVPLTSQIFGFSIFSLGFRSCSSLRVDRDGRTASFVTRAPFIVRIDKLVIIRIDEYRPEVVAGHGVGRRPAGTAAASSWRSSRFRRPAIAVSCACSSAICVACV